MSQDSLSALLALIPTLIAVVALLAVVVVACVVGLILLLRQFVPALRDSVPADLGHKSMDLAKSVLMFGLNSGAAKTESLEDDEMLIRGLQLLGADVTGSPETGYTITVPPKTP